MAAAPLGFTFTETMGGFIAPGAKDFHEGAKAGRKSRESFRFKLTIAPPDLAAFLRDPSHEAPMVGTVDSNSLGTGLQVRNGRFNLLQRDEAGRLWMRYYLEFTADDGIPYALEGYKDVQNNRMVDFWYDTTALFTKVYPLAGDPRGQEYQGILRIRPIDLVPQVLSMRGLNARNPLQHLLALARFGWFFFSSVTREYARPPGKKRDRMRAA